MKYYIDGVTGKVHAYDDDAPSHFVAAGLVPMSKTEVAEYIRNAIKPAPTAAEVEREWRDSELVSLIWLRDRHRDQLEIKGDTNLTPEQFGELLAYMQALRDWPQLPEFPNSEHRPKAPAWIADQTE